MFFCLPPGTEVISHNETWEFLEAQNPLKTLVVVHVEDHLKMKPSQSPPHWIPPLLR
jgi:hypothetical protein